MSHDASVEQQMLATIDKWVEQELRPVAREFDQADEYPGDLVEQMKELQVLDRTEITMVMLETLTVIR